MSSTPIYRVLFVNNGKSYEVYSKNVQQGHLYGFVEIEELLFNNRSGLLVDPSEEKLKSEFEGVKRSQIPMHSIIRIDEVEKQGISKIGTANNSVIAQFPTSNMPTKP